MVIEASNKLTEADTIVRKEEVIAMNVQGQIYRMDCVSDADLDDAEAGDFILENGDDNTFIFCSGCNKRIT
jgi:hypothetical protein